MPPNFQNGKIYSIRSHQTEKIYIGSTTQSLAVRFGGHKRQNCSSQQILQFDDAYIELIELFPCDSKMALNLREGEIIRTRVCVNKVIPGRTKAEYYEKNKEKINQYREDQRKQYYQENKENIKQYYENNKTAISTQQKQNYEAHKKIRICSCGGKYNEGKTSKRNRHYRSKCHIEFVNDFYERLHHLLVPD